ncbi:MAG TPA: GspE/PulE family protein [Pirellulaceae bacterium]|nr:GspE/PulE family protein [Pirellulaceae bacterium]
MSVPATNGAAGVALNHVEPHDAAEQIIRQAIDLGASDLFILSDEGSVSITMRVIGQIEPAAVVLRDQGRHLINYFKTMAQMDIAEHRRPQEGRWIFESPSERVDLRINVVSTLFGEDLAVRILNHKFGLRSLDSLGLSRPDYGRLTGLLASPSGLLLVTGPTGTGKTTTLYACLQHLNTGARKINTIEDPIEYAISGVRQSQANPKLGVDFPDLLKNILRQAPDVIMIGEVRDVETAATAVRAANSGHLVLATLHSPVAAGAVQSLRALGTNPYFVSSCLLGIVAQRLVRVLCQKCRIAHDIRESPDTFADIKSLLEPGLGDFIYGPGGCEACRRQGYQERTGVFELMTFNHTLRQMLLADCSADDVQQEAIKHGMVEFRRAAMLKVAQGITSTEEVLRELPAEYLGLEV